MQYAFLHFYINVEQDFHGLTIKDAFDRLHDLCESALRQSRELRRCCKYYCIEHWHYEDYDYARATLSGLLYAVVASSYHNPVNIGLLKFLADKSKDMNFINSVNNYESKFSCVKICNLYSCINVEGTYIKESDLIVNTLWENEVTVGQLWNFGCILRVVQNFDEWFYEWFDEFNEWSEFLYLNASAPLLEFVKSIKVCIYLQH